MTKGREEHVVEVAPLGVLRAYTISEHELDQLEQGTPVSDLLTVGLALLGVAMGLFASILTLTTTSDRTYYTFVAILLASALGGAICTFLGYRGRKSTKAIVREIRNRMPTAPPVQQLRIEVSDVIQVREEASVKVISHDTSTADQESKHP